MRLLIDANIVLDVLQARQPHLEKSALIWKLCETGKAEGYISALTFANIVYVIRKELDPQGVQETLGKLLLIFLVADLTGADLRRAADLKWNDFEDAVQYSIGERIQVDYIVTRNVKDFMNGKIIAFTPDELLERI